MSRKIDRAVSESVRKSTKYLGRTIFVLFIGFLSADTFGLFEDNHDLIGGVVLAVISILTIFFVTLTATFQTILDYENSVLKGINYMDNLSLYLEKIRGIMSLSNKEIVEKTKLSATIEDVQINFKEKVTSIVGEIRHELGEREEEQQTVLMKGYKFPKKPPRIYIFWRKKVLGIPPMTSTLYTEKL